MNDGERQLSEWLRQGYAATAEDDGLPREKLEPDGPYFVRDGRISRRRQTKDGPVVEGLCNFSARIVEEVVLDDGAETTRAFIARSGRR